MEFCSIGGFLFADMRLDMEDRDQDGNIMQHHTTKYDMMDVLHTGKPPDDLPEQWRWVRDVTKRFNLLDCHQARDEVERMPRFR